MMRSISAALALGLALGASFASPSAAQSAPTESGVFLGAMSECLEWLEAGAPEAMPFEDWDTVESPSAPFTALVGAFSPQGSDFTVAFARGDDHAGCVGQESGLDASTLMPVFESWLAAELETGRLVMTPDAPEFGRALAICAGPTGGGDLMRDESDHMMFFFETGSVTPPEGVCDA